MLHRTLPAIPVVVALLLGVLIGSLLFGGGGETTNTAHADDKDGGSASPVKPVANREMYYPGTEALAPDEMRVIACGTGMPNARPKQAAACWLVELGNGDKFLFDIGTGSAERISAMQIPYNYLDKISGSIER